MFKTGETVKIKMPGGAIHTAYVIATFEDEEGITRVRLRYERIIPGNSNRQLGKITPDIHTSCCLSPTVDRLKAMLV